MLTNYLKVAIRNITKHRFFSIINILGLTIGIAGCLFIAMYIYDELNYDKFHSKAERIYRVNLHGKLGGQELFTSNSCLPMSKALVAEIPEVEEAVRVNPMGEWIFRNGDLAFNEEGVIAVDSNFFNVFDFELLKGNPENALIEPQSIVLNEELAVKYFGDENPLGQMLSIGNDKTEYKVTGVVENERSDSHIKYRAILSTASFPWMNDGNWLSNSLYTYYVLSENGKSENVDAKLEPIMETNVTPTMQQFLGKSLAEFRKEGGIYEYYSFPMLDIHLKSTLQDEMEPPGDMAYVYILGGIGLFIVLLACINFMNLTTAKSAGRAKEVGLRKTLGSQRNVLVIQFLTESMVYAVTAAIIAVGIVYLLLPYFNTLSGKLLGMSILLELPIVLTFIGLILFIGLLAGSYPAFYLTSFKITEVLKGKLKAGMKSGGVRSFLVTFQFWISIVLIICTAMVYQQLQYMQSKNLGIDKDHVILIEDVERLGDNMTAYKNSLNASSAVEATSFSNNMVPGVNNTTVFRAAGDENDYIMATYFADYDHLKTLGFELKEGRFFSRDFPSDSSAVVINEAAVREFGWENPLEEYVINFDNGQPERMKVIGVTKDFNFESLKVNVRPLVIKLTDKGNILYARFAGDNLKTVIQDMETNWDKLAPGEPLQYSFLDEDFDALFRAEQRLGKVFTVFTILAIFIASLGLFGLASFMAEQRTKEIGIRKVMGASVLGVTALMSKEFTKLVIIAFILAVIPAYYIMDSWLNDFATRIDMNYWVFIISGSAALFIAWLTVSYQSLKAARINPVKSLRYE